MEALNIFSHTAPTDAFLHSSSNSIQLNSLRHAFFIANNEEEVMERLKKALSRMYSLEIIKVDYNDKFLCVYVYFKVDDLELTQRRSSFRKQLSNIKLVLFEECSLLSIMLFNESMEPNLENIALVYFLNLKHK